MNFTEPIHELQLKVTEVLTKCREMGAKRFIAHHLMDHLDAKFDRAIQKVKDGAFDDIPDPVQEICKIFV